MNLGIADVDIPIEQSSFTAICRAYRGQSTAWIGRISGPQKLSRCEIPWRIRHR